MITVPLIDWQPMDAMPDDRKDGRPMLLWEGGPVIGYWANYGDGDALNGWEVWLRDAPMRRIVDIKAPTDWADINPPA